MKVVQINACYGYSSTGRTSFEMHRYLTEHGIESFKFYSMPLPNSDRLDLIGNWFDHKLHALLTRIFGRQGYFSTISTKKLIIKLKKLHPDIVILRNLHGNYMNFPKLATYLAQNDIATIVVLHDCWFFTGYCYHYTEIGCKKWQTQCDKCPLIKSDKGSWFFDTTRSVFNDKKKLFDAIPRLAVVGVSDWITNEGRRSPVFRNAIKFQRIYNWISLDLFYPRESDILREKLGLKTNDFVALGVSMSWSFRKGLEVYIRLAQELPEIKFVMIGARPDVELPSNIISIAPTNSTEELATFYSMADVLLNFSIQETFGKVAAEALACGTPLIVNNATANPEIPGDCGYIIEDNNLSQAVTAINEIKEKGRYYYQQRCINRAHILFEKNKNLNQYLQLFNELNSMK